MNKRNYLIGWGFLFILCAGLGFLPEPNGILGGLLTGVSVLFFLPPVLLLREAKQHKDRQMLLLIRNLSALSLLLTLVLLVCNFLSVIAGEWLGLFLYYMLVIVSSPMICSGHWAMSLFLWSCLLVYSHQLLKNKYKKSA